MLPGRCSDIEWMDQKVNLFALSCALLSDATFSCPDETVGWKQPQTLGKYFNSQLSLMCNLSHWVNCQFILEVIRCFCSHSPFFLESHYSSWRLLWQVLFPLLEMKQQKPQERKRLPKVIKLAHLQTNLDNRLFASSIMIIHLFWWFEYSSVLGGIITISQIKKIGQLVQKSGI